MITKLLDHEFEKYFALRINFDALNFVYDTLKQ